MCDVGHVVYRHGGGQKAKQTMIDALPDRHVLVLISHMSVFSEITSLRPLVFQGL